MERKQCCECKKTFYETDYDVITNHDLEGNQIGLSIENERCPHCNYEEWIIV